MRAITFRCPDRHAWQVLCAEDSSQKCPTCGKEGEAMTNRIEAAIARNYTKLKLLDQEALKSLSAEMTADLQELFSWQMLKSLAQSSGILSLEEAQVVYEVLVGESPMPEKFAKQPLSKRMTVVTLMWELTCSLGVGEGDEPKAARGARRRKAAPRAGKA